MAKKKIADLQLWSWIDSETEDFVRLVGSILAALPGGDLLGEYFDPAPVGWKEIEILQELLEALEDASDVAEAATTFATIMGLPLDGEEENHEG